MPEVAFILSEGQPSALRELAETVGHELAEQGVPWSLCRDGFPEPRDGLVHVWLDPPGYLAAEGDAAIPADTVLARTVILYDEHRVPVEDPGQLELSARAGAVFVLDASSGRALHPHGLRPRLLRPGYSAALDRFDPDAERPIDVTFLGTHSLRRTRYLARAAGVLSRYPAAIQVVEDGAADAGAPDLEESKWALLRQSKVLLNLHRDADAADLEWRRVVDAIHAGTVVVSEHSSSLAPLIPGEHLLVASADALPFVAQSLLRDPERLERIRLAAYERLRSWMPFALSAAVLRAALVELVGAPLGAVPPPAPPRSEPPDGARSPRTSGWRAGAATERRADAGGGRGEAVHEAGARGRILHETPAWSGAHAPAVSVVTALNATDAHAVQATLDSIARSALGDLELVVVDDGRSPASLGAAHDQLRERPHVAAQLIRAEGVELAGARNAGMLAARAPAVLFLDAGQEIYPRCLTVLLEVLHRDWRCAFAYPIQEVVGDAEGFVNAGGDYLMSYTRWEPDRLRRGNPVHAPALVRAEHLRALGGFATDARLRGFEDYDLWCRMAERGLSGVAVSEELARRPESAASPVLACLRPTRGPATAALLERSPGLLAGAFDQS